MSANYNWLTCNQIFVGLCLSWWPYNLQRLIQTCTISHLSLWLKWESVCSKLEQISDNLFMITRVIQWQAKQVSITFKMPYFNSHSQSRDVAPGKPASWDGELIAPNLLFTLTVSYLSACVYVCVLVLASLSLSFFTSAFPLIVVLIVQLTEIDLTVRLSPLKGASF